MVSPIACYITGYRLFVLAFSACPLGLVFVCVNRTRDSLLWTRQELGHTFSWKWKWNVCGEARFWYHVYISHTCLHEQELRYWLVSLSSHICGMDHIYRHDLCLLVTCCYIFHPSNSLIFSTFQTLFLMIFLFEG